MTKADSPKDGTRDHDRDGGWAKMRRLLLARVQAVSRQIVERVREVSVESDTLPETPALPTDTALGPPPPSPAEQPPPDRHE